MENIGLIQAAIAIVVGVLILLIPRLLNYAVAIYLIVIGVLGVIANWPG